jgi:DNA (cytosine-5)-methyltransferase 1
MGEKRFKAIDLFSGAGGLSLGFELAGIDVVAAIEYCSKATTTYEHNFPEHLVYTRDIKQLETKEVVRDLEKREIFKRDIDLVIGGPPCPGFSNIGRSKLVSLVRNGYFDWGNGETRHQFIQDPRNELFLEFIRFVNEFKPRGFVMENVGGMLSSRNSEGQVITEVIKNMFDEAGYECKHKILHANHFGVPQARQRVFFIGWRKRGKKRNIFSHPEQNGFKEWTAMDAISDLPDVGQDGGVLNGMQHIKGNYNEFQRLMRFKEYKKAKMKDPRTKQIPQRTVPINCHKGRTVNPRDRTIFPKLQTPKNGPRQTYDLIEPSKLVFDEPWHWDEEKQRVVNHETGFGYKWYNRKSFRDKMRRIAAHKPSPTLVAHMALDTYMYIHPEPNTHRTITPREAARIQSFPDSFDFSKVPFTSQYRQIGNAVPPLMAKAIALEIIRAWK